MSESEKEVFKVVQVVGGQFYSVWLGKLSPASINYKVGEWNKPNPKLLELGHGILCFENYINAKKFLRLMEDGSLIFKALARNAKLPAKILKKDGVFADYCLDIDGLINYMSELYSYSAIELPTWNCELWPTGTLVCDELKLIEVVK